VAETPKRFTHRSVLAFFALLPFIALSVIAVLGAPANKTQDQTPTSALKPDLQPLSFFIGHWSCAGEFPASHKPISSHISISSDLDGSWLAFRWDDNPPNQFHALELWGFDKIEHHFTNSIYNNFGGVYLYNSAGWLGDQLTWGPRDLPPNLPIAREQYVIDRKSTKEFVISWEIVRKSQTQWTVGDRLTCHHS
jgi:hypothetical protein